MKKWTDLAIEHSLEYLEFGNLRQSKVSLSDFKGSILPSLDPVFFLSTGRTGTALFTAILNRSHKIKAYHSPKPELIAQSKVVYEAYRNQDQSQNRLIGQIYLTAREENLRKCFMHDKRFIETNNRITFFAPALLELFPKARFIHIYRDPKEFIRSGMRRMWYHGNSPHEQGRIVWHTNHDKWQSMSSVEKIAWLWSETNEFIVEFFAHVPNGQKFSINMNELNMATIKGLFEFLAVSDIPDTSVDKLIHKGINAQRGSDFPRFEEWKETDRKAVALIVADVAAKLGYSF